MYRNYLKTAVRGLLKNKFSSFINVSGLAVGMAVSMLIGLWIWNEISFDKSFKHYDRISQVMQNQSFNGEVNTGMGNVIPLAAELRRTYGDDFKHIVLSSWNMNSLIAAGEKKLSLQGSYMESDAPEMLSLNMVAGTRKAFNETASVLLSQSTAKALFGNDDPVGKIVKIDGDLQEKVAGVYEDFPLNTSFKDVAFIAPFFDLKSWISGNENNWYNSSFQLFVELSDKADHERISAKIKDIKLNKIDAKTAQLQKPQMFLFPMSKWHLYSDFKNGSSVGGRIQYVWMFGIIGLFVLLLACINFMNLSTARSEKRAKEIGIRKAVGSLRSQLVMQFFCESLVVALCGFVLSVLLVLLILPFFNQVTEKNIHLPWSSAYFWMMIVGFTLLTGLIAGIYPALYLSSFRPVKVLKGVFKGGRYAATPRKVLVVVQFTVSVILIISTMTVFRQVQFAKSRPIGYTREGLITIVMKTWNYHNSMLAMRNDLLQQGAIAEMAESNTPVTENDHFDDSFNWKDKDPQSSIKFNTVGIAGQYGKTIGWQFVNGRDFSPQMATDSSAIVINETAAKYIGFKNPVGEAVKWRDKSYTVIGVIKDMVMESPYAPTKQTVFYLDSSIGGIVNIRLSPNRSTASSLALIEAVCKKYSPEEPFDYKFADEDYARKFADEERVGKLAGFFAILAIFISCLGLFGMASFVAEQRTKEIGVRKVLGASVLSLWELMSKEFVMLAVIAFLIASPVAYYFMHNWLQNYEYRAPLSWLIFVGTGVGSLVITLLTVSYQSIKAALANPVNSLRTE